MGIGSENPVVSASGSIANGTNAERQQDGQRIYFRPQWTKEGVITKRAIVGECERLSGTSFSRKRSSVALSEGGGSLSTATGTGGTGSAGVDNPGSASHSRKRARGNKSKINDVAKAVIGKMWSNATGWLNQARHQGRISATKSYAFVVTPRVKAKWAVDYDTSYFAKYRDIKDAWMPVGGRTLDQCEEANKNLIKELISMFPKLEFRAQYEVQVVDDKNSDSDSSDNEESVQVLHVTVNIINEALKYLTSFFQFKSAYQFMRLSSDSCRLVFVVSMSMVHSLHELKRKVVTGTSNAELEKFMAGAGLLVEGEVTRNQTLSQTFSMSREKYEDLNEGAGGDAEIDRGGLLQGEDDAESADEFDEVVFNL